MEKSLDLKVGDKVCYHPSHYPEDKWENGIVKDLPEHSETAVRVVYYCNDDWDNYYNYTSALTNIRDLSIGWRTNPNT